MTMTRKPGTYSTVNAYMPRSLSQRLGPSTPRWEAPKPCPLAYLKERGANDAFIRAIKANVGTINATVHKALSGKFARWDSPAGSVRARLIYKLSEAYTGKQLAVWLNMSESTIFTLRKDYRKRIGVLE